MLGRWLHHQNWHRPHHGLGKVPPISRLLVHKRTLSASHPATQTDGEAPPPASPDPPNHPLRPGQGATGGTRAVGNAWI